MANTTMLNEATAGPLLSSSQVAELLGVHARTVCRLAAAGNIQYVWFSNRRRFRYEHAVRLLARGYGSRAGEER